MRVSVQILCSVFAYVCYAESIIISTKLGKIEGIKTDDISVFKNIPYAEPPINELRWQPTKPLKNPLFNGVHNGTVFGNACNQPSAQSAFLTNNSVLSEDCLTLNIFTPYNFNNNDNNKLKKVLFWVHGGGLTVGTANTYDAIKLASVKDVIVVTINYRLGVAGFLVNPELYNTKSKTGNGGSNGLLDMIEALKWVNNNIISYGGDKNEIAIIGDSGGAWGVCGLSVSPLARGLFKRIIQMSGSCIDSWGMFFSNQEAMDMSKKVINSLGVTSFNELKTMDMQIIIDTFSYTLESMIPSIDGYFFPESPINLLEKGYINGESIMLGTMIRESFTERPFYFGKPPQNESQLYNYYNKFLYDTQVNLVKKHYPFNDIKNSVYPYNKSDFNDTPSNIIHTQLQTDCWVRCGTLKQAKLIINNNLLNNNYNVYFYQYGYYDIPYDQVSHGYDVLGLFGADNVWLSGGVPYYNELEKITMDLYVDYAKGIVPNINGVHPSYNNGYYILVNNKLNAIKIDELKSLDNRCELYDILGNSIYRNPFCFGYDAKDLSNYPIPDMDTADIANDTDTEDNKEL